jgi:hypothetical protein
MKSVALLATCAALPLAFSSPVLAEDWEDDGTYNYYVDLGATVTKVESFVIPGLGTVDENYVPIETPSPLVVGGAVDLSFWFDIYEFGLIWLSWSAEGIVNDFHLSIGSLTFPGGSRELIIGENSIDGGYGFTVAWSNPELYTSIDGRTYEVNFFSSADGLIDIDGVYPEGVWAPANLRGYAEFISVDDGPATFHGVYFGQVPISETDVVPEPATWALMIVGFGLVGSALRRRQPALT